MRRAINPICISLILNVFTITSVFADIAVETEPTSSLDNNIVAFSVIFAVVIVTLLLIKVIFANKDNEKEKTQEKK